MFAYRLYDKCITIPTFLELPKYKTIMQTYRYECRADGGLTHYISLDGETPL